MKQVYKDKILVFLSLIFIHACNSSDVLDLTESQRLAASFQTKLVDQGYTQKEAASLAEAGYKTSKDKSNFSEIMPLMTEGAVASLSTSTSSLYLADTTTRLNYVAKIVNASFKAMKGEGAELSLAEQKKLRGQVASSTMNAIKSASVVEKASYDAALKKVTASAISNLSASGIDVAELQSAAGVVSAEVTSGLKAAGFETTQMDELANSMVSGGIESIKLATTDPTAYDLYAKNLVRNAIGNTDEMGLTTAASLYDALYDITNGGVAATGKAGLTSDQMDSMVDSVVTGAVSVFDDIGITDENLYDRGLSSIVQGAVGALDDAYGTNLTTAQMKTKVSSVVTSAMDALTESFDIDEDNYVKSVKGISSGAITGLLAAGYKKTSDAPAILEIAEGVTTAAIAALDDAGIPSFYIDADNNLVNMRQAVAEALTTGVVQGLEATKLVSDADIKAAAASIAQAAIDALEDGGVSVADSAAFKTSLDTLIDDEADSDEENDDTVLNEDEDTDEDTDASLVFPARIQKRALFVHAYYEDEIIKED